MSEVPETVEDAAAGILNGTMLCLLGSAFPVFFVWQFVRQWGRWTIEPGIDLATDAVQVGGLSIFGFLFVRTGVRLIRESVTHLRERRSTPAD